MAQHSIVISKIEWTLGYGPGGVPPDWWENHVGAVERAGADLDVTNWIDCTFDGLPTTPDEAYDSAHASSIYVPGTGWTFDTAGTTDTIASHLLHLSTVFEATYNNTIFAAIGFDPDGPPQNPAAVRVTVDVNTALSGPSADLEAFITHSDLFGEFYLVRQEGGPTNSVPAKMPISATGTAADIGSYVHTFLIVPTGSAQFDMEGFDMN